MYFDQRDSGNLHLMLLASPTDLITAAIVEALGDDAARVRYEMADTAYIDLRSALDSFEM
jgi:hypothetical protein